MARRDYYDDSHAPKVNSVVPAVTAFVVNERGELLLEQRSDNGRWGLPGGVHQAGETIAETVVREVLEETGISVEVTGLIGIYTNPGHVIAFDDGEVRQEFSLCFRAKSATGEIQASSESLDVRWIPVAEIDGLTMSQSTRRRIDDALAGLATPVIA